MKKLILWILIILNNPLFSQDLTDYYWDFSQSALNKSIENSYLGELPKGFQIAHLDLVKFGHELKNATNSEERESEDSPLVITLPTPEGNFSEYYIYENSVISPEVRDLYTIKTYKGYSKKSPHIKIRCDLSAVGFHAFIYNGKKSFVIEPNMKGNSTTHIIYFKDKISNTPIKCGVEQQDRHHGDHEDLNLNLRAPSSLRTFKLAYVASGEYSQQYGGIPYNATNVLNSLASAVNLVNPIYERDLGVSFTLVTTTALVFPDPTTDPFDLSDQNALIDQNHIECNNALGSANYDIGHLLVWANTGGLAAAGVVCWDTNKGKGFSGADASFVTLIVDYSCHEIGHQFNASHNFVSHECQTSSNSFRFEPGEGSSIMSYAGVCGAPASYQNSSNQYFHSASINVMNTYIADTPEQCQVSTTPGSGNSADPVSAAQADITIPKETPFILVGSATDANDSQNQLTYLWEQNDGNGVATSGSPSCMSTNQPLFRYRNPASDNFRIFPEMNEVLGGNNSGVDWEKLPCVARSINFNLIARDNNTNWGRTGNDQMLVTVANTGPFAVIAPNGGETWNEGTTQTVSWSENGTSAHCANVDILLSTDNGSTFTVVASAITNDGSQAITVPSSLSTTARILIQCSTGGNFKSASTFFDASNAVFNIEVALPVELMDFEVKRYMDDEVEINWTTASEINSSHFEVEKSNDAYNFNMVDKVNSVGNSTTFQEYATIDRRPFKGVNYYRLKQVDIDGSFEYSSIKTIQFSNSFGEIQIYPNPAKDIITIKMPDSEFATSIKLTDQLGRTIQVLNQDESSINVSWLPNGIYYLSITSERANFVEKLLIGK